MKGISSHFSRFYNPIDSCLNMATTIFSQFFQNNSERLSVIRNLFNGRADRRRGPDISNRRTEHVARRLRAYIPVLSNPSFTGVLRPLFLGWVSSLDAFSSYPLRRSCPAMPCRTTGTPEAAIPRSSRTRGSFPSEAVHLLRRATQLSHDVVNPAHDPF